MASHSLNFRQISSRDIEKRLRKEGWSKGPALPGHASCWVHPHYREPVLVRNRLSDTDKHAIMRDCGWRDWLGDPTARLIDVTDKLQKANRQLQDAWRENHALRTEMKNLLDMVDRMAEPEPLRRSA